MTIFTINPVNTTPCKNKGINLEHALCAHYGIERVKHDNTSYKAGSDIEVNGLGISVKADGFSLMSGRFCEGLNTFDEIWNLYKNTVHSNRFAYIAANHTVYMMNINEFERFVYAFGRLTRESERNGGGLKIRMLHESKKMLKWLATELVG